MTTTSGKTAQGRAVSGTVGAFPQVKSEAERSEKGANQVLLGRLLAMARQFGSEGNLRQAQDMYWELVEAHPGTAQADAARTLLLEMAGKYERDDAPHMARSIYNRLLADQSG